MKHLFIILPAWSLQNLKTLNEYYNFHGNVIICMNSLRFCSLYNWTQLEMDFIFQDLDGVVMFERDLHRPGVTRKLWGIKTDFGSQTEPLGKPAWLPCSRGSQPSFQVRNSLLSWEMKGQPQGTWGAVHLRDSPQSTGIAGKGWRELRGLAS